MSSNRKQVVIIGGSFGGLNAAYELRRQLGHSADITLISKDSEFTFLPSLPWVILGWREPDALKVALEKPLRRKGVRFVHAAVEHLDPDMCEVETRTGKFRYDAALIASGADLDYEAVPGLGPDSGYTHSTFTASESVQARDALSRVLAQDSGRIVIGATAGASCIGPAYELVMMIDTVLKRAKRRHRFSLTFLTPEPFLGHFGVGGIGASPRMVQDEFAERSIDSVINAQISEARPDRS